MYKRIISYLNCNGLTRENILSFASQADKNGWDELYVHDSTNNELKREGFLVDIKSVIKEIDIPVMIGTFVRRFEDIKKALYTGAKYCVIDYAAVEEKEVIIEGAKRFPNKIILDIRDEDIQTVLPILDTYEKSILGIILTNKLLIELEDMIQNYDINIFIYEENICDISTCLEKVSVNGVISKFVGDKNIVDIKNLLKEKKVEVNTLLSSISFKEFKLNSDGLIPVITQDYKTGEVLMLAYMNQEAFEATIQTGRMTYYSRSRNELWIKGETSSHYQYVKSLDMDCDKDTLLAKVKQVGVACHTGSRSCFYTNLVRKEYEDTNSLNVMNHLYAVIKDRKDNPKEGSYTNYLFDKGIDKILKKCGEEATEIIIAAKNQDPEELKYEISDFIYHLMVLMVECDLDPSDIIKELANR